MITDTATFEEYANRDADFDAADFPTRAEVENLAQVCANGLPTAPKFAIVDELSANWLLSKLAAIDGEAARIKAQADQRAAELRADRERLLFRFGAELEAFARLESERRRRRTISLLQGTLTLRTVPAKLVISDGEAAFVNARTVCAAAIVEQATITLDKATYLAFAQETGDLTGVEVIPAREAFAVKFPNTHGAF